MKTKTRTKILSLLLAAIMTVGLMPVSVRADSDPAHYTFDISQGSITVSAGTNAGTVKVAYGGSQTLDNIAGTQAITIISGTGSQTSNKITVNGSIPETINITLSGVTINNSGSRAFSVGSGSAVSLTLIGTNSLTSGYYNAGLGVPNGAVLNITAASTGSLQATGVGAGIGGNGSPNGTTAGSCGTVTINGGTVTAAGTYGAGIGGGANPNGDGGDDGGTVTINGGTVTATSANSAGIGGGYSIGRGGDGGTVTITDGTVTATGGNGAGIGGGGGGSGTGGDGGTVTITGGTVTAKSSGGGAGIGGGFTGLGHAKGGSGGTVTITGGTVTATGGTNQTFAGAGIGGGASYGIGGSGGTVTINGGTVTATSALGTAIGGGFGSDIGGSGGTVTINGGTVTAKGGTVDDSYAVGIGGGFGYGMDEYDSRGLVTINGGSVSASSMGPPAVFSSSYSQLYLTTVTIPGISQATGVTYTVGGGGPVACSTDRGGKLYLWLPAAGSATDILITAGSAYYQASGTVSPAGPNAFAANLTAMPLAITTTSLPNGIAGAPYSGTALTATGGTAPYTWSATGMPAGLSINSSTGVISGTPTDSEAYPVTVTLTDGDSYTVTKDFTLTVYSLGGGATPVVTIVNGAAFSVTVYDADGKYTGSHTISSGGITGSVTGTASGNDTVLTGTLTGVPATLTEITLGSDKLRVKAAGPPTTTVQNPSFY